MFYSNKKNIIMLESMNVYLNDFHHHNLINWKKFRDENPNISIHMLTIDRHADDCSFGTWYENEMVKFTQEKIKEELVFLYGSLRNANLKEFEFLITHNNIIRNDEHLFLAQHLNFVDKLSIAHRSNYGHMKWWKGFSINTIYKNNMNIKEFDSSFANLIKKQTKIDSKLIIDIDLDLFFDGYEGIHLFLSEMKEILVRADLITLCRSNEDNDKYYLSGHQRIVDSSKVTDMFLDGLLEILL